MVMLALAQLAMQCDMHVLRGGNDCQSLANCFASLGISQVTQAAQVKLIPVSLLEHFIHAGYFPVCRTPGLFKVKVPLVLDLIAEQNNSQCNLPQAVDSLIENGFMSLN